MFRKLLKAPMFALLFLAVACSSNKQSDDLYSMSDDDFLTDADFLVDGNDDLFLDSDLDFDPLFDDGFDDGDFYVETQQPVIDQSFSPGIGEYTVRRGDTLLLIAFNIYGDYTKWRDISRLNNGISHINEGQVLQYEIPAEEFVWNPQGNPHLIREGETLGTISSDKYGTSARWRSIYDNNRPMIQDPNLIFAGFTLYYIPDRGIASEPQTSAQADFDSWEDWD